MSGLCSLTQPFSLPELNPTKLYLTDPSPKNYT